MRLQLVVDVIPDQVYPNHNNQTYAFEDLKDSAKHGESIRITTDTNVYAASIVAVQQKEV